MADSDDEFVSASEGEYEDSDDVPVVKPTVADQAPTLYHSLREPEQEEKQEALVEPSPEVATENVKDEKEESESEEEEVTRTGRLLSQISLSREKKELIEEAVKEVDVAEQTSVPETIPTAALSEVKGFVACNKDAHDSADDSKSSVSTNSQESSAKTSSSAEVVSDAEVKQAVEVVQEEEKKSTSKKVDAMKEASASVENDDDNAWDDWGEEKNPEPVAQKASTEGWDDNDWSLVDESKMKPAKEDDPWFREQLEQSEKPKPAAKKKETGGAWGLGGLMSVVGETFTSTIESSLGLPSAEEYSRKEQELRLREQQEAEMKPKETVTDSAAVREPEAASSSRGAFGGFGMLTGLVSGGIDVLEHIGKKTFETITVTDPNRGGRRRFIFEDDKGENLSDVLKEMRAQREREQQATNTSTSSSSYVSVGQPACLDVASVFGRSDGMVHLEALELLSRSRPRSQPKFERMFLSSLNGANVDMYKDDTDFCDLIATRVKAVGMPFDPKVLLEVVKNVDAKLDWSDGKSESELFDDGVNSLVELTAASVQVVSKLSNLLLVSGGKADSSNFIALFECLAQMLNSVANRYSDAISNGFDNSKVDELSTQLLVESSTAVDFVKQAFKLIIPLFEP